jgi:phosphoglycerate dehydrogenase-like enzyme
VRVITQFAATPTPRTAIAQRFPHVELLEFEPQRPPPAGHWMYFHPRVRLSAHVSWYTQELQRAAVDIFLENLGRFVCGDPLLHVVDAAEDY